MGVGGVATQRRRGLVATAAGTRRRRRRLSRSATTSAWRFRAYGGLGGLGGPFEAPHVHGSKGGGAAVSAVAHPAAGTLAEVVVDARVRTRAREDGDGLGGRHETGVVQGDAHRVT